MITDIQNIQMLLDKNIELQVQQTEVREASIKARAWHEKFIPQTYLFTGVENEKEQKIVNTGTAAGIGFKLNLFSGFKDLYGNKVNSVLYDLKNNNQKMMRQEFTLKVRELYYDLLGQVEVEKILQEESRTNQTNIEVIKKKISGGVISSNELLENRLYEIETNEQLQQLKLKIVQIKTDISQLLNLDSFELEIVPQFLLTGIGNFPTEKQVDFSLRNVYLNQVVTDFERKKWGWTSRFSLDLFGEYAFTRRHIGEFVNESIPAERIIGLKLVFNITDEKNQRSVEEQNLALQQEKQKLNIELVKSQNEYKKKEFSTKLIGIDKNIEFTTDKIKLLSDLYQSTLSGFKSGTKEAGILNEVTKRLFSTRKELVQLRVEKVKLIDLIHF